MKLNKIFMMFLMMSPLGLQADMLADVQTGMWETTSTTSMTSAAMSMPAMTNTSSHCVTEEDIEKGKAFMNDMEDCEIISKDIRSDGLDAKMTCNFSDAGEMDMQLSFKYQGESMTGVMTGTMNGPMGEVDMKIELSSNRTGDC